MTTDISPFLIYVRSEYLYSLKEGFGYFTPATVFAISARAGETLKLQILADDSVMFSNIPISGVSNSKESPKLDEENCVYSICPNDNISIIQYEYLNTIQHCAIWNKNGSLFQKGIYMFSIEFATKELFHFIELADGNYSAWANEWITWGEEIPDRLPEYKKDIL